MGGATNRIGGATSFPYPAPPSQIKSLLNANGGGWIFFHISIVLVHYIFFNWISFFSMFYKILQYYVYYYCILIRYGLAALPYFRARFYFFPYPTSLLIFFFFSCFFVLFHSCCSHSRLFGKTLVHESPISYSHTEWYLPFFGKRDGRRVIGQKKL